MTTLDHHQGYQGGGGQEEGREGGSGVRVCSAYHTVLACAGWGWVGGVMLSRGMVIG